MRRATNRLVALVLIVFGAALVIVSALGDEIGGQQGFGWKQIAGVAVGGASLLLGVVTLLARSDATRPGKTS